MRQTQLPDRMGLARRSSRISLLMILSMLLVSCGGIAGKPAPSSGQAVTIRLGYFPNLTHAPALLGLRNGAFATHLGRDITLKTSTLNAGPEAVEALLSNSLDASYIGPNPAINAFVQSRGKAVRVVAGATAGGASLIVQPAITAPSQLRGKALATPQLGNTQDVALRWWLGQQGLKTQPGGGGDVKILPQDNAQTLQSFRAGQIDGAWVPEPWASRLVLEGGGRVLVDERDVWPHGRFATTLLLVRTDFLQAHPNTVRRLIEGQVEAIEYLNQHPQESQSAVNAAIGDLTGKKLGDPVVAAAWQRLSFTNDPLLATLNTAAEHAHDVGLLPRADLKGLADLGLLNQVLANTGQPQVST